MRNTLILALAAIFSLAALSGCASAKKKCCPATGSCCPTGAAGK